MELRLKATGRSINHLVYLVFDLEAGRFLERSKMSFPYLTPYYNVFETCGNSQRKPHQMAQICHFEPQKFCNEKTVKVESIISNSSESLRISVDNTYAELRSVQVMRVVLACKLIIF